MSNSNRYVAAVAFLAALWAGPAVFAQGGGMQGGGGPGGGGQGGGGGAGVGAGRPSGAQAKKVAAPGTNTDLGWGSGDFNAARAAAKPILLYVFDDQLKKDNPTALYLENQLFPDAEVKKALAGYTSVMLKLTTAKGWPQSLFSAATGGCALYLMTSDGTPYGSWTGRQRPKRGEFVAIANQVSSKNPAVAEQLAKNPPQKFEDPQKAGEQVAQNSRPGGANPLAGKEQQDGGLGRVPGVPPKGQTPEGGQAPGAQPQEPRKTRGQEGEE